MRGAIRDKDSNIVDSILKNALRTWRKYIIIIIGPNFFSNRKYP